MGTLVVVLLALYSVLAQCLVDLTSRHTVLSSTEPHLLGKSGEKSAELHIYNPTKSISVGEHVLFQLPHGENVEGTVRAVTGTHGGAVMTGDLVGGGSFGLSYFSNTILANIQLEVDTTVSYELRPLDPTRQRYVIREVSSDIRKEEHPPAPLYSHEIEGPGAQLRAQQISARSFQAGAAVATQSIRTADTSSPADTNGILDVMFIFTPQAFTNIGGTQSAMAAFTALAVQLSNDALVHTKSPLRMRAVSIALSADAAYIEQGFEHELVHLQDQNDGVFDADTATRTTVGADSVVLFVASSSYCGLAYQWATTDTAFAVVSTQCPSSVAHEVGHNIGLNHDRQSLQDYNYSVGHFNFGYCWDTSSTTCSRSVMAYAGCVTPSKRTNCHSAPFFSSPEITNGALGRTTGVVTSDNARVLREQADRATNWMLSTTSGGLIFTVQPGWVTVNRCEPVVISGWRLMDDRKGAVVDEIVSVTLAGAGVQRILTQDANSVEVLTQRADSGRTGDVVVTTRSGYTTTLRDAFAVLETSGNFTMDFDSHKAFRAYAGAVGTDAGRSSATAKSAVASTLSSDDKIESDVLWTPTGTLPWSVLRYCDALPCDSATTGMAELHGPLIGYGGGGDFAKLIVYDTLTSADSGAFTVLFNSDPHSGCTDNVYSVSLYYHMYTPHSECRGSLSIEVLNALGVWVPVASAHVFQAKQTDPWLPLQYAFPDPAAVHGVRISAVPCKAQDTCFSWSSVSVDAITLHKSTACAVDGCDYISAYPTAPPTIAPTHMPSHGAPTAHPTSASPTVAPSAQPTLAYLPALERVRFQCTQTLTNVSAERFQGNSTMSAGYLLAVAEAAKLPADSVCCLSAATTTAQTLRPLSSTATAITFTLEIVVPLRLTSLPVPAEHYQVSQEGRTQVNVTHRLLEDSVASGQFLSILSRTLGDLRVPGMAVMPMTDACFSAPVATLTIVTNSTASPMELSGLIFWDMMVIGWSMAAAAVLALLVLTTVCVSRHMPKLQFRSIGRAKYHIQPDNSAVANEDGPDSPTLSTSAGAADSSDTTTRQDPRQGALSRAYSGMGNFLSSTREPLPMPPVPLTDMKAAKTADSAGRRNFNFPGWVGAQGSFSLSASGRYRRVGEDDTIATAESFPPSIPGTGSWESPVVATAVGQALTPGRMGHQQRAERAAMMGHASPQNALQFPRRPDMRPASAAPAQRLAPVRAVSMSGSFFAGEKNVAETQPPWLPAREGLPQVQTDHPAGVDRRMHPRSVSDLGDRWIELSHSGSLAIAGTPSNRRADPVRRPDAYVHIPRPHGGYGAQDSPQNSSLRRITTDASQAGPALAMNIPVSPRSAAIRSAASNFTADPWQGGNGQKDRPSYPGGETDCTSNASAASHVNATRTTSTQELGSELSQSSSTPQPDELCSSAAKKPGRVGLLLPPPLQTLGLTPRHLSACQRVHEERRHIEAPVGAFPASPASGMQTTVAPPVLTAAGQGVLPRVASGTCGHSGGSVESPISIIVCTPPAIAPPALPAALVQTQHGLHKLDESVPLMPGV